MTPLAVVPRTPRHARRLPSTRSAALDRPGGWAIAPWLLAASLSVPAIAQARDWSVFARDDGCVDPQVLARSERLARAPRSPEDFARMLRARGERPVVGAPAGLPTALAGRVVQVRIGPQKAVVFVRDDACRDAAGKPR